MGLIRSVTVLALLLHVSSLGVNGLAQTPGKEVKKDATLEGKQTTPGKDVKEVSLEKPTLPGAGTVKAVSDKVQPPPVQNSAQDKSKVKVVPEPEDPSKGAPLKPEVSKEEGKPLAETNPKVLPVATTDAQGPAKPNGEKEKLVPCESVGPLNGRLCKVTPADKEHTTPGGTVRRAPGQGIPDVKKEGKQPDVSKEGDKSEKGKPKASPAVPPLPTVTKPKPESATAISSTIPAVLISSVVFLYLSHVGH